MGKNVSEKPSKERADTDKTTIVVTVGLIRELKKRKQYPRSTMEEVIRDQIKKADKVKI